MSVSVGLFLPSYLVSGASFYEVFLKDIVKCRVQLLSNILNQKGTSKRQRVLQVILKVFVIQRCDLKSEK